MKNVLPSACNCQKPNCRQNPSDKNPLTALIQFLNEISCWKVTEKPSTAHCSLGFQSFQYWGNLCAWCPYSPCRLINESTNSYWARLPWGLQVISDVPLQFNSKRKKNRFFWLLLNFPFIKSELAWKDHGSPVLLFSLPWTFTVHKEQENAI